MFERLSTFSLMRSGMTNAFKPSTTHGVGVRDTASTAANILYRLLTASQLSEYISKGLLYGLNQRKIAFRITDPNT